MEEEGTIVRRVSEDDVEDGAMRSDDDDDDKIIIIMMMLDAWDNGRDETWWSLRILL